MKKNYKKLIILTIIVLLIIAVKISGIANNLNMNTIIENRSVLLNYVESNYILVMIIFITIYILAVALSIPGASILTITGGFLFGPILATIYINISATVGALLIFLITRYILGSTLQKKYETQLKKFNNELEENGTSYLLTLRLIPIFPFFLINILAGLTNVSIKKFIWTTSLGIIPGTFIYAYLGYSGTTTGENILSKEIIIALVLMGLLSLVPVIVKKLKPNSK